MKDRLSLFLKAATAASLFTLAACGSPQPNNVSVAEALAAPDDTEVVVTAAILQDLGNGRYLLSDGTGQLATEIDADLRGEIQLAPDTQLRIYGELDRDDEGTVLDARTVQVVR